MVGALRADAVRRELVSLSTAGLGVDDFQAAAAELVARAVPYDATCWATVDPATNLLTGSLTLQFDPPPELEARFAEVEASGTDVNSFRHLAERSVAVTRLSDSPSRTLAASPRLADIYAPLGFEHELRAAFAVDAACWGVAGLLRARASRDFDDDEVGFLAGVAPIIARGLRRAMVTVADSSGPPPGSAVLVADASGRFVAATPAAQRLFGDVDSASAGVRLAVRSVVAAVRLHGVEHASARARVRGGAWLTITAAPLRAGDAAGQVAVTVEPTPPSALTALLLTAHGLTAREHDVCRQVLAGRSTADIGAALFISTNTVQDHLKSIFDKIGVRSRRELVAYLATHG